MKGLYRFLTREPKGEPTMPAFIFTTDNASKNLCTVDGILMDDGTTVACAGISVAVLSGDGTVKLIGNDGNPLPANQAYLVSGDNAGDTSFQFTLILPDGRTLVDEPGTMTVTQVPIPPAPVKGLYTIGAAEPK